MLITFYTKFEGFIIKNKYYIEIFRFLSFFEGGVTQELLISVKFSFNKKCSEGLFYFVHQYLAHISNYEIFHFLISIYNDTYILKCNFDKVPINRSMRILDMFFYATNTIDGEKTSLAFFFSHENANFTHLTPHRSPDAPHPV